MKRITQIVCIILIIATVFAIPVAALEYENQRGSNYFMRYSVYLHEVSNSQFEVWFDVTALDIMDEVGVSEIQVQRSTDQVNWTTVKTYTKENYSQMTATNRGSYANCVTYNYTSGYYYSAIVELYAKDGSSYGKMDVATPIEFY